MRLAPISLITVVTALACLVPTMLAAAQSRAPAQGRVAPAKTSPSKILVTPTGMTLYVFALDKPNVSNCYATCAKAWPPMTLPAGVQPATSIPGITGKFGLTTRKDGTKQLTYNGAPLYTFIKDKAPGDLSGQGLFALGGYWWAVVVPGGKSSSSSSTGG